MAQEFKELASIRTDMNKFNKNFNQIDWSVKLGETIEEKIDNSENSKIESNKETNIGD